MFIINEDGFYFIHCLHFIFMQLRYKLVIGNVTSIDFLFFFFIETNAFKLLLILMAENRVTQQILKAYVETSRSTHSWEN